MSDMEIHQTFWFCVVVVFCCFFIFSNECPFSFCNHLDGEEKAGCFTLIVLLMYCGCWCSVALPGGVVGWFVVCDCGIS